MQATLPQNILIFLLASIGLIALPHVSHLPMPVFVFFSVLLAWRFFGIWQPQIIPRGWPLFLLAMGGLAILYGQQHTILGRDAGTCLFMIGLGLKLMEVKNQRDLYLTTYMSFIVAASQFLYEQSILMAAYILLVCCVLLASLVFINSHTPKTWTALKKAASIIAQAIPMAIIVFILFPRVEAPHWMWFHDSHQAKMGLSDIMEPGSISDLGQSDELVFRVKFAGVLPPPQQLYWRGPVLTETDGKRWTQDLTLANQNNTRIPIFNGTTYRYTLLMEPQHKNWVFALDMPTLFPNALSQNANYQLQSRTELHKRSEYIITSHSSYNTGQLSQYETKVSTHLPKAASERIKQLVLRLQGFTNTPENYIQQLLDYFRQQDFYYTLTPPLMEDNPIETFLFDTRHGFCSHYASAFVYLMRVANIPARVVTGYQGGVLNPVGNFLEVRQAEAHAWAEVWLENKGWVRIDPTAAIAPERIEKPIDVNRLATNGAINYVIPSEGVKSAVNWLNQARQLWGNVDYNWQRWVINYNTGNQTSFLSNWGIHSMKAMVYWLGLTLTIITTIISLALLYRRPIVVERHIRLYNRFLTKLAKLGIAKLPGEGPVDFAGRAKSQYPQYGQCIDDVTNLFIDMHYGKNPSKQSIEKLRQLIANFSAKPENL